MSEPTADTVTSVEQDGRILSGVGASAETLQQVMDDRTPADPETPPPAPGAPTTPAKPETRGQRRFSELTRERNEARSEAAAAKAAREAIERERDEWRARFDAAQRPAAPQPAAQSTQSSAPQLPDHLKNFDAYLAKNPNGDYDAYRDEKDDWRQDHLYRPKFDAAIRDRIEADVASRSRTTRRQEIGDKGRSVFPDFDAVVPNARLTISEDRLDYIDSLPHAHAIIYQLAKDPALDRTLATVPAFRFGEELARLVPAPSGASSASPGTSGGSTPPPPMQPVGSGSRTTAPTSAELIASAGTDYDKSGYREKRAAERKASRR